MLCQVIWISLLHFPFIDLGALWWVWNHSLYLILTVRTQNLLLSRIVMCSTVSIHHINVGVFGRLRSMCWVSSRARLVVGCQWWGQVTLWGIIWLQNHVLLYSSVVWVRTLRRYEHYTVTLIWRILGNLLLHVLACDRIVPSLPESVNVICSLIG